MSNLSDAERVAELTEDDIRVCKMHMQGCLARLSGLGTSHGFDDTAIENVANIELNLLAICDETLRLRTELASVTARLAAAEEKVNHAIGFLFGKDVHIVQNEHDKKFRMWRDDGKIYHPHAPKSEHDTLDAAIAAAVSAGGMKPLGDNTKEPT